MAGAADPIVTEIAAAPHPLGRTVLPLEEEPVTPTAMVPEARDLAATVTLTRMVDMPVQGQGTVMAVVVVVVAANLAMAAPAEETLLDSLEDQVVGGLADKIPGLVSREAQV